jgi:hypothetical protein
MVKNEERAMHSDFARRDLFGTLFQTSCATNDMGKAKALPFGTTISAAGLILWTPLVQHDSALPPGRIG